MGKALEDWQIEKVKQDNEAGKTVFQLAKEYNVHYRTIENYLHPQKLKQKDDPEDEDKPVDIKIIGGASGKTLNFYGVTKLHRLQGWIHVYKGDEVIGILIEQNVTAIIPLKPKEEETKSENPSN